MTEGINYDPGFWTKTSWIQLGYGVWVSMAMVGMGLALNFPAVTIPQLKNDQDFEVTLSDEAWIASVLTLVSPLGCIVCGYLIDKCGRRVILIMCELPMCIGWIYTGCATSSIHMILGRVLTGLGVGMAIGAPRIFITEISLPNMRGVLGAFPNVGQSIGLTLLATCGVFMQWTKICLIAAAFTFVLFCSNFLIPETPYYTLMKSSDTQALASLKKFRSSKYNTDKELSDMIDFKAENNIRRLSFKGEMSRLITKAACKPFCIIIVYMLVAQLTGVTVMFVWTIDLLQGSKISTDAGVGNVVLGVTRFLASILSSILLYRIKRRPQALISSIGAGLTCIVLATHIQYTVAASSFPLVCFVIYVIFATLGHYTLPLLIMYELYPLQIRGLLGGISSAFLNLFIFGTNKFYPYLRNWIGHANVILCFGICSLLGSIFLYLYLPETTGLTLQEIEEYFNDRRATLVSQRNVLAQQLHSSKGSSMLLMSPSKIQLSKTHHKPEENVTRLQLRRKKKKETEDAEPGTSNTDANTGTTADNEEKAKMDRRKSKDVTNTKK